MENFFDFMYPIIILMNITNKIAKRIDFYNSKSNQSKHIHYISDVYWKRHHIKNFVVKIIGDDWILVYIWLRVRWYWTNLFAAHLWWSWNDIKYNELSNGYKEWFNEKNALSPAPLNLKFKKNLGHLDFSFEKNRGNIFTLSTLDT